jgi:hypothetical protein
MVPSSTAAYDLALCAFLYVSKSLGRGRSCYSPVFLENPKSRVGECSRKSLIAPRTRRLPPPKFPRKSPCAPRKIALFIGA